MIAGYPLWAWALLAGMPLVPLLLTVVNLITWRRPRRSVDVPRASVLVPARDEQATIEACVRSALREPVVEVVVYDDGSTDETAAIVERLADEDRRVRLVAGVPLPAGWVGKPHACHRLAAEAVGDVFLFVDADTTLLPGAVASLAAVPEPVVTSFPRQLVGSMGEGLVVSLLHLTYLSWLPLALVAKTSDPRVLAANGQVLWAERRAYERVGGFAAVRDAIVDDMALCRRAKEQGVRVAFVPGGRIAQCRMYRSAREAWRGFAKNLYPGLGSPAVAVVVGVLYVVSFVLPWVGWVVAPLPALVGLGANVLQRALLAVRFRLPPSTVALHLPSVLAFLGILVTSARWTAAGRLWWRGRSYPAAGGAS